MIEYQKKFEAAALRAGFKKIDEPVDTDMCLTIAMRVDNEDDFDICFWQPAMHEILRVMKTEFDGKFYELRVSRIGHDVVMLGASLGKIDTLIEKVKDNG